MKKVAIVQSNYIPWKGYFDLIGSVDELFLYDEVQYTRRDWRNRNLIKTPGGLQWVTIPVEVKGRFHAAIRDIRIADPSWGRRHWAKIAHSYASAPHFDTYRAVFKPAFVDAHESYLSLLNRRFLELICSLLGIKTTLRWSWEHPSERMRSERLVDICKSAGANVYVSGPAAKAYLDEQLFEAEGMRVEWIDYSGYPEYPQLNGSFEHRVTVLDLLFNAGGEAAKYMKFGRAAAS